MVNFTDYTPPLLGPPEGLRHDTGMNDAQIPELPDEEINDSLRHADSSSRRRYPKILHNPGDELNRVVNFMMQDSYMQPHLHPGEEKIEHIYLIQGRTAVMFFDDQGAVQDLVVLENGLLEHVEIPAFTWHTYVMLSTHVITYETMMGQYEPTSWKEFAPWAPPEHSSDSLAYLTALKAEAANRIGQ